MGSIQAFFSSGSRDLEQVLHEKRSELHNRGRQQANSAGLTIMEEARALLESCAVLKKAQAPEAYVDLALALLAYPTELAFVIAAQFSELEGQLGYQPFGTIMTAIGNIDTLYRGVFVRLSSVVSRQEMARVLEDQQFRLERAGRFMAVAIIMSASSISRAQEIYRQGVYGPLVKPLLDQELEKCSPELARAIKS